MNMNRVRCRSCAPPDSSVSDNFPPCSRGRMEFPKSISHALKDIFFYNRAEERNLDKRIILNKYTRRSTFTLCTGTTLDISYRAPSVWPRIIRNRGKFVYYRSINTRLKKLFRNFPHTCPTTRQIPNILHSRPSLALSRREDFCFSARKGNSSRTRQGGGNTWKIARRFTLAAQKAQTDL